MLSGLSSQMSGLDKGGGLGHTGTLPEKKDRNPPARPAPLTGPPPGGSAAPTPPGASAPSARTRPPPPPP